MNLGHDDDTMEEYKPNLLIQKLHRYAAKTIYLAPDSVEYSEYTYFKKIQDWQIPQENLLHDIYFIPNIGGTTDASIDRFSSVFVDLDAGRSASGEYKSLEAVAEYKRAKLQELDDFPVPPSAIVDTRNGLHPYWILDYDTPESIWRSTMAALIKFFDGDPKAKNPARLMRVPDTYWIKPYTGLPKYPVTLLRINDETYHIDQIREALPAPDPTDSRHDEPVSDEPKPRQISIASSSSKSLTTGLDVLRAIRVGEESERIELIRTGRASDVASELAMRPVVVQSRVEGVRHLVSLASLAEFLGVPARHCCLFHDDTTPSAGIFRSERDEDYLKCQSSRCGFEGNIITITMRLRGCSKREAINFLLEVFRIEVEESEMMARWRRDLEENLRYVTSTDLAQDQPDLARSIGTDLDVLESITEFALDHLLTDSQAGPDGLPVFFVSVRELSARTGIAERSLKRSLLWLRLHGVLRCCEKSQIPQWLRDRAEIIANRNGQKNTVNFYVLPRLDETTVALANERADLLAEYPLHQDALTWEGIYRTYGLELAASVFPDREGHRPADESERFTSELLEAARRILELRGWVCEESVIAEARSTYRTSRVRRQFRVAEHEIARELGLRSLFVDRETRDRLRIPGHVRRVIVPVDNGEVEHRSAA